MKKMISWVLVVFMMTAVFAGCTQKQESGKTETSGEKTTEKTTEATNDGEKAKDSEPVTIKWHIRNAEPQNFDSVMAKMNEYLTEKINVKLDLVCVEPGEWGEKLPIMYAASEEMDLIWAATWGGFNFKENIPKGAYMELDDLLKSEGAAIYDMIPPAIWDAVKINGHVYGIPNYQIMADQKGFIIKKDLVEKYNIDVEEMKTKEGLLKWLQVIKDNEPNMYPIVQGVPVAELAFEEERQANGIFKDSTMGFVDTKTWDVIDREDEKYKYQMEEWELAREFYERGFLSPDIITIKDIQQEFRSGKYAMKDNRYKPGADVDASTLYGFDVMAVPVGDPIISPNGVLSTLTAISKTSQHPAEAMKLFSLVNTDKELYNMLIFGLEGQDYNKTGENRIELIDGGYMLPAWMMGNQFNAYLLPGQADDVWEETEALNQSAKLHPLMGFNFDSTDVQVEQANMKAVIDEYGTILTNGVMNLDEVLPQYYEKIDKAGSEKVQAEKQRQLDEWVESNNK